MHYKIGIILLLLLSCSKKEDFAAVQIIGHACNGMEIKNSIYHDNSYEAAELALSMDGCQGIEVDVQLSADGSLYLFHDPDLTLETKAEGCVPSSKDEVLDGIHYQSIHQEKLAKLTEVGGLLTVGKTVFLDLRHYNSCTAAYVDLNYFTKQLQNWRSQLQAGVKVFAVTNYTEWLPILENAGFSTVFSSESMEKTKFVQENYDCDGFMMKNDAISKTDVQQLKAGNKKVIIFEVRSPKGIRKALKKLPDYLMTDDLRATIIEKHK